MVGLPSYSYPLVHFVIDMHVFNMYYYSNLRLFVDSGVPLWR